jgi:serine/threonine protein kinase
MRGVVFEEDPPFLGLILAFYPLGSMKNVFKERDLPLRTKVKVRLCSLPTPRSPPPPSSHTRLQVLYGIGLGIAYLHKNGIEHRDLWPANVLLDADFTAKLADFGLAITRQTKKIPNKCQFRWSSPQRCSNHLARNNRFEPKNDVWSFGMICYWALTAEKPYKDIEKGNMVRYELERGAVPRFNRTTPELPHALVEAVQLCWIFATRDRPPMAEVCGRLARVLERDSARLGDDHPDAGPVDRQAWRALMPGKRDGARQRESSDAIRLRALDADIDLLIQRREALREHYSLVTTTQEPSKTKKSTKKLLATERTAIAQRMKAEIAALTAEIEHKQERREQLVASSTATATATPMNGSAATALSVSTSSTAAMTSSTHRHRRHSGTAKPGAASTATTSPSQLKETDDASTHSDDDDNNDNNDDNDDAASDGDDEDGDASTSASDDGKPQPLGPRTRAVVALRDEPARTEGDLALVKGAQIYLLHRGATAKVLNGVDVARDKHGNFPLTAVRGVSRHKEEEIARAFGNLRKRQRPKHAGDASDDDAAVAAVAALPEPVKYVASVRRNSSSSDGNDQSYADAMSSVHHTDDNDDDDDDANGHRQSNDADDNDDDDSDEQIETHLLIMPPIADHHAESRHLTADANDSFDDAASN